MTWIHYLLIFWFVSLIVVVSVRVYNLRRRNDAKKTTLKQWLIILVAAPFALLFVPIIPIGDYFDNLYKKWKEKKEEEEEIRFKATLGLGPDENYLCFSHMGGAGIIKCADCGYEEKITSFTHGSYSCTIGRQCPNCYAFVYEYNESEKYHTFGKATEDFVCKHCGAVVRKKEESIFKGNDDPLFCPKCHSVRLRYRMIYIT